MKMYFAEQGNNWGYTIGLHPGFCFYALYNDGGVFDWANRKSDKPLEVAELPFGSCIIHFHRWHKIYCSVHQFVIAGRIMLTCAGYGKSKKLSLKNLESCRKKAMDEWYKDQFKSLDLEIQKRRGNQIV